MTTGTAPADGEVTWAEDIFFGDPRPAPGDGRRLGFAPVRARVLGASP